VLACSAAAGVDGEKESLELNCPKLKIENPPRVPGVMFSKDSRDNMVLVVFSTIDNYPLSK